VSGDHNPIHLDRAYAATTTFGRPIAHGMLVASMFSTVFAANSKSLSLSLLASYLERAACWLLAGWLAGCWLPAAGAVTATTVNGCWLLAARCSLLAGLLPLPLPPTGYWLGWLLLAGLAAAGAAAACRHANSLCTALTVGYVWLCVQSPVRSTWVRI
jgi:hypothetical protein